MPEKPGRPKQYLVAIRRRAARPEETRFEAVDATTRDNAVRRLLAQDRLDPKAEEIVGVTETRG